MPMKKLAYKISHWNEVVKCQSNNSRELHLKFVLINDDRLTAQCVQVVHDRFGCLFAVLVDNIGGLIERMPDESYHMIPTQQILDELEKFGFIIDYEPDEHLDGNQLRYLITLDGLGFQKIRALYVRYSHSMAEYTVKKRIVAFNVVENPDWLLNTHVASEQEFTEALNNGSAINITNISQSKNFNWEFLGDKVLNIEDILKINTQR